MNLMESLSASVANFSRAELWIHFSSTAAAAGDLPPSN